MKFKHFKQIMAASMAVLMTGTTFGIIKIQDTCSTITAHAAVPTSGTCGTNLTWTINSSGALLISGTGTKMDDYSLSQNPPWYGSRRKIKSVVIRSLTLPKIGDYAFYQMPALEKVVLPGSLKTIGVSTFEDCEALSRVELKSVNNIMEGAFWNCKSLKEINIASGTTIGDEAFGNCGLESITLNNVTVGSSAFASCKNLTEINLNNNVSIGSYAFSHLYNLTNINVPVSSTTKYNWEPTAFTECKNLQQINHKSVTRAAQSKPVLYNTTYTKFMLNHFNGTRNVGFCSIYSDYYCDYVLETQISPSMTDLQKAKAIHDWIIEKVDYDHISTSATKNHTTDSIFLNDRTVCEGYARGYAKLMNKAGIQTYYLSGGNHAWNLVNICGDYYHVDCCWDDTSAIAGSDPNTRYPIPRYSHFLLLDEDKHESLKPWEVEDYTGNPRDLETVHAMGEVVGNGKVSAADANLIRAWLAGNRTLTKAQRSRADVNIDGKVTIADAILIEQFVSSGQTNFHNFFTAKLKPSHQ